ncbi:MAG: thioredoxin-disulfide reductase [Eubacteriales bacterium]|nr:thioredoxin-disulfide reductase [Eubacteriales bacterium]
MEHIYDMIVIGGGPAGYTAALYGSRAGLDTLVLEKQSAGGQMAITNRVDNYPGFPEGIDGYRLGQSMEQGARRSGAKTEYAEVTAVRLAGAVKEVDTGAGTFRARTVVLATGAEPRELGLPGEGALVGRGLHYCAACDGMFYRGKTVVVVGGGNTAAADALMLSRLAQRVILVHRRDSLRAAKIYHQPLKSAANVELRWNTVLTELVCGDKLTGVGLRNVLTGEESRLACHGVFVSIGRRPATELVRGQLVLDEGGYVMTDESTRTNVPGVFAPGDVRTKALRQIVTAVADGAMAAQGAEEYLAARDGAPSPQAKNLLKDFPLK